MKISCPLKVLLRKLLVRNLETITFFAGDSHKKPFFIHKRLQFKVNKKNDGNFSLLSAIRSN